ncbi:hypothetical protein K438DRAFT_1985277 [Mycena galopus ATCC 62051]|nr:hypothetical protein K438DRAFT_1985277 [Mycena galopus ATCC 62051]
MLPSARWPSSLEPTGGTYPSRADLQTLASCCASLEPYLSFGSSVSLEILINSLYVDPRFSQEIPFDPTTALVDLWFGRSDEYPLSITIRCPQPGDTLPRGLLQVDPKGLASTRLTTLERSTDDPPLVVPVFGLLPYLNNFMLHSYLILGRSPALLYYVTLPSLEHLTLCILHVDDSTTVVSLMTQGRLSVPKTVVMHELLDARFMWTRPHTIYAPTGVSRLHTLSIGIRVVYDVYNQFLQMLRARPSLRRARLKILPHLVGQTPIRRPDRNITAGFRLLAAKALFGLCPLAIRSDARSTERTALMKLSLSTTSILAFVVAMYWGLGLMRGWWNLGAALLLAQICKQRRAVALATPELWTSISLNFLEFPLRSSVHADI